MKQDLIIKTIKQAIINYINARAERLKPCEHDWELLYKGLWTSTINPEYRWTQWTYACRKCKEVKKIDNEK